MAWGKINVRAFQLQLSVSLRHAFVADVSIEPQYGQSISYVPTNYEYGRELLSVIRPSVSIDSKLQLITLGPSPTRMYDCFPSPVQDCKS